MPYQYDKNRNIKIYKPELKKFSGNDYIVIGYDKEGNAAYSKRFRHIDICPSISYFYCEDPHGTVRLPLEVVSMNLAAGIITIYYKNGFWIEITKKYER